jgi:UDP-GlcNAc:undecaprenyl-phosphate GlcNAc-1-phosphate transferase
MGKLYIFSFLFSFFFTFSITPLVISLSKKFSLLDMPNERKVHLVPLPRWGGVGIYVSLLMTLFLLTLFSKRFHWLLEYRTNLAYSKDVIELISIKRQLVGLLIGGTLLVILGTIDDKKGVPAIIKLLVQIIVGYIVLDHSVRVWGINLSFTKVDKFVVFSPFVSQLVTLLWLVGFMNVINLIDGLDGLACGVSAITFYTFLVIAILQSSTANILFAKQLKLTAILSSAMLGSCLGFLRYNFNPAKIFLGDTGAYFLGYMIGAITLIGQLKTTMFVSFLIPTVVAALPIIDVMLAILRRVLHRKPLIEPDKEHIHHKLLSLGLTHREVVLLLYVITLICSSIAVVLAVAVRKNL